MRRILRIEEAFFFEEAFLSKTGKPEVIKEKNDKSTA